MNFIKNKFVQKLIFILVILLIFNIAIPKKVQAAWDVAGILMKPVTSVLLSVAVSIDTTIGLLINGASVRYSAGWCNSRRYYGINNE